MDVLTKKPESSTKISTDRSQKILKEILSSETTGQKLDALTLDGVVYDLYKPLFDEAPKHTTSDVSRKKLRVTENWIG